MGFQDSNDVFWFITQNPLLIYRLVCSAFFLLPSCASVFEWSMEWRILNLQVIAPDSMTHLKCNFELVQFQGHLSLDLEERGR